MACLQSKSWLEGAQLGYEISGEPLVMPESTIPIDLWISNHEQGLSTLATIAHLQFPEWSGFDKDCNGQFVNASLSRLQQWSQSIYELAQDLVVPGYHCNNPAESIIIIDAVDSLHDKNWAETADRDYLKNWGKIHLLKLKILTEMYKEMLILVTGKY